MTTHLTLLALLISTLVTYAEESTFEKALDGEKVKMIVSQAAVDLMAEKNDKYPRVIVEPRLYEKIVALAGATKVTLDDTTKRFDPAKRLKQGVGFFFKDYRDFVGEREKHPKSLVLGTKYLEKFFEWVKKEKGCGKIPCDIPPCCGNCDDC